MHMFRLNNIFSGGELFMLHKNRLCVALCFCLYSAMGWSGQALLEGDGVSVTEEEFTSLLRYVVPDGQRSALLADERRLRESLENYYVIKKVSAEARKNGVDKQAAFVVKTRYETDSFLTNLFLQEVGSTQSQPNFELLAKEYYLANKDSFIRPEEVRVSHILVAINDERDEAQALSRAEMVRKKLEVAPDKLADIAGEYSDDPSVERNKGDMGYFARGRMVKPFEDAAFAMSTPGEISTPVKTQFGYHVLVFKGRKASSLPPFDSIKAKLIEQERKKFLAQQRADYVNAILKSSSFKDESVKAMVEKLSKEKLDTQ